MSQKHNNECNISVFTISLIITILFLISYVTGHIKFFVNLSCCLWIIGLAIALHLEYKTPVKPNSTHPNTPANKENTNNNPVKQIFSPNISEVDQLTKQIESIKNDFKIINHKVDNSIFNQFNLLKKNLYLEYEKINWKENTNKEISEKYQAIVDSYVEAMNNEYLKIKQQFTDILNNEIKSKIDNVEKQFN
jgi:hypothetical protein